MNLGNIGGKITKNIDKIAKIGGAYGTLKLQGEHQGVGTFEMVTEIFNAAISDPHFPDIENVILDLTQSVASPVFMGAVKAGFIGYVLKELGLHPGLNKLGNILYKGGFAAAEGSVIMTLIARSTIWHSPKGETGSIKTSKGIMQYGY